MQPYRILDSSFLGAPLPTGGTPDRHIHIVGGGIAGLLTGFYLKQLQRPFTLYEKGGRCGGLLGSHSHGYGRSEQAANGFLWCPELQEVCDVLELPMLGPKATAKARYLVRRGGLRRMPLGVGELLSTVVRAAWPRRVKVETVEEFGQRYLGPVATRQVLEPAFAGIYGADIGDLSFPGALTALAQHMHHSPSLPLALRKGRKLAQSKKASRPKTRRSGTHSFEGGMGALVERLQQYLQPHIALNTDGLAEIDGDQRIVLATPAYVAKDFFEDQEIRALLEQVIYTPILTATLFVRREDLPGFKEGFGCLVPRNEGLSILGVLFNSSTFAARTWDEGHLSLTCILREDASTPGLLGRTDPEIAELLEAELHRLLGLSAPCLEHAMYRWPRGIPLYSPALYESWFALDALLRERRPHVNVIGNYTGEISIRRMCQEIRKAIVEE